jgi:hypothetical protein
VRVDVLEVMDEFLPHDSTSSYRDYIRPACFGLRASRLPSGTPVDRIGKVVLLFQCHRLGGDKQTKRMSGRRIKYGFKFRVVKFSLQRILLGKHCKTGMA